ncbi:hypothetical protein ES703_60152 [subsurface metagenome]
MTFHQSHWFLKDLQYTYLDDGFTLVATTDVPCHLFARMTTTPPRKHALPSYRRGLYLQGDIRFCFVVYEDNEQAEAGDTLIHTFAKSAWPVCETRWFYFLGTIAGISSPSESPIFEFHFPAPPPEPPPPLVKLFFPEMNNRTIRSNDVDWGTCWSGNRLLVMNTFGDPNYTIHATASLTASYWILRAFLTFDTTSLPFTFKPLEARLMINDYLSWRTSSVAFPYLQITPGHQSDPVHIDDFFPQNAETLVLGQIDYLDLPPAGPSLIDLNQAGLNHIDPLNPTKYCLRAQLDVENQSPPLGANGVNFYSAQKGPGYRPYLRIVYYPA